MAKFSTAVFLMVFSMFFLLKETNATAYQIDKPGSFEPVECWFEDPLGFVQPTEFQCGYVIVPEMHENPDGPTIKIPVAIKEATSANPLPDPLFLAQGGPGGDAFEVFPILLLGSDIGNDRDIVIFNQRGTLYAEPDLSCPETIEAMDEILTLTGDAADDRSFEAMADCYKRLEAEGVNLSAFNSLENAADVDLIREALGYEQYNFYGVSYGTLLGLHLMRNHPENLRSVIIDGVVPPDLNFISEVAVNTDRVFSEIINACENSEECREEYPNLEERLFNLVDEFNANPTTVTIKDAETGEKVDAIMDGDALVDVLFRSFYFPDSYAIFPKLVKNLEEGDYTFIEKIWPVFAFDRTISEGMYFSVICAEDADLSPEEAMVDGIRPYFAENAASDLQSYLDSCEIWRVDELPASIDDPVQSDIPTLLFSGHYDPITPPSFAAQAAQGLDGGFSYVHPTGSHGVVFDNECTNSITQQFLNAPDVEPDSQCLDEINHADFIESDAISLPFVAEIGQLSEEMVRILGWLTVFFLGIMSAFLILPIVWLVRKLRRRNQTSEDVQSGARRLRWVGGLLAISFGVIASVFIVFALYFIFDAFTQGMVNIFSIAGSAGPVFILPLILVIITIGLVVITVLVWREPSMSIWLKIYYTFLAICAIGYLVVLHMGDMLTVLL